MYSNIFLIVLVSLFFPLVTAAFAGDTAEDQVKTGQEFLKSLVGKWEGTCRTWFRPGELADESNVKGEVQLILGGYFLRHSYKGEIQGKPRTGEETIAFNSVT